MHLDIWWAHERPIGICTSSDTQWRPTRRHYKAKYLKSKSAGDRTFKATWTLWPHVFDQFEWAGITFMEYNSTKCLVYKTLFLGKVLTKIGKCIYTWINVRNQWIISLPYSKFLLYLCKCVRVIYFLLQISCRSIVRDDLMTYPDSKVHGANMGPTWVLSAPDGPHVGPMNLAIRVETLPASVALCEVNPLVDSPTKR